LVKIKFMITYKEYENFNILCEQVVNYLIENKIIGWFQGRSEFGPRALGNRSILANPTIKDNKDYINKQVKHREEWRPYAPIMLEEHVHEWYDLPKKSSPYMLFNARLLPDKVGRVPAVTHIDGTARVQTVSERQNKPIFQLLKEFYKQTTVPILLNTSFNVNGEPIVESPEDALETFKSSKIDYLVMGNFLFKKSYDIV